MHSRLLSRLLSLYTHTLQTYIKLIQNSFFYKNLRTPAILNFHIIIVILTSFMAMITKSRRILNTISQFNRHKHHSPLVVFLVFQFLALTNATFPQQLPSPRKIYACVSDQFELVPGPSTS
jgi:hypothetical protein